jgi:hypothetical protein
MPDTPQTTNSNFRSWCIVEIMGHQRFAGLVTEESLGGTNFVRIDVPETAGVPAFTKLFGSGSIYCITPCSEETAKRAVEAFRKVPFYEFSALRPVRIGGPSDEDGDDDYDDLPM